ncbi:hypothetical protein [Corynebacterium mastitidis]
MLGSVFVLLMGVVFLAASAVFSRKAQACVPTAKKLIRGDVSQEIWDHHVGAFFDAVRWVRITAAVAWIMLCAGAVVITVIMMVQDSDQWGAVEQFSPSIWAVAGLMVMVCLSGVALWHGKRRWDLSEEIITGHSEP